MQEAGNYAELRKVIYVRVRAVTVCLRAGASRFQHGKSTFHLIVGWWLPKYLQKLYVVDCLECLLGGGGDITPSQHCNLYILAPSSKKKTGVRNLPPCISTTLPHQ